MSPPPDKTSACPVDHAAREVWLAQARAASAATTSPNATTCPVSAGDGGASSRTSWAQTAAAYLLPWRRSADINSSRSSPKMTNSSLSRSDGVLGLEREVSSIPRSTCPMPTTQTSISTSTSAADTTATAASSIPASSSEVSESIGSEDSAGSGSSSSSSSNWVYPSEKMFFDAMRRKGHAANPSDMKTVVPIHNAVNERAWAQIRAWEDAYCQALVSHDDIDSSPPSNNHHHQQQQQQQQTQQQSQSQSPSKSQSQQSQQQQQQQQRQVPKCPCGPRLTSFANNKHRMTPTARLNTILGYAAPFDRHDWVIDRCGTRVDYVIDFYAGRAPAAGAPGANPGPSFFLDVRPKLNTWEGVRMRACRWLRIS